jgi:hypothetical protein
MTNLQMFFSLVGVFVALIGAQTVLLNARISGIETRLVIIEGDLRRFYQLIGEHTGKIELLEKK